MKDQKDDVIDHSQSQTSPNDSLFLVCSVALTRTGRPSRMSRGHDLCSRLFSEKNKHFFKLCQLMANESKIVSTHFSISTFFKHIRLRFPQKIMLMLITLWGLNKFRKFCSKYHFPIIYKQFLAISIKITLFLFVVS